MIFVTWEEFDEMLGELVDKIKSSGVKYDCVYGIPKGGLTLAVCLSYKLEIPLLIDKGKIDDNTLVVDDISDNGTQLSKWYEGGNDIATLYSTSWTKAPPKYNVRNKLNKNDWIVYPWENREEVLS